MLFPRSIPLLARARSYEMRAVILTMLTQDRDSARLALRRYSEDDWQINLQWLDTSALALYLLGRLTTLGLEHVLPARIRARLLRNLADNRERNFGLLEEAVRINRAFTQDNLVFANLKGITLSPESVPDPALRFQIDLDFLILKEDAERARVVLASHGYVLEAMSGSTWEFKSGLSEVPSMNDLYRAKRQRCVELHLADASGPLSRVQLRSIENTSFPVLAPADLYLSQAAHLAKHIRSAFTRAAWIVEYRQHTLVRGNDDAFWQQLTELVRDDAEALRALAFSTEFIVELFQEATPVALDRLIAGQLSAADRLWIRLYAVRVAVADYPGTKLHLLLDAQPKRRELIPLKRPPMITHTTVGESLPLRCKRYRVQVQYFLFRMRFHCREGARYLVEASRFRRRLKGFAH